MAVVSVSAWAQGAEREFRGAWLHTIFQGQYSRQSTQENKEYIGEQLDLLKEAGCNVVIFQVRPQADAFYESGIEPWSRHLTGEAGVAPSPLWDPLQFIIGEAHARGMELHAWLNPYRVTTAANERLPKGHIYHKHPERFVRYGGLVYFDPALQENRDHIVRVVTDIVARYDVDAIHIDDYFYPYPKNGAKFPDDKSYSKYGGGMKRGDWRRKNVDMLIEQLHEAIAAVKPWVRFGVSPFGIWRNKASDARGSETRGLQNYDDLYADVLLWARRGWIDYTVPQLYWELENKAASAEVLSRWWNDNDGGRHMYIGQDVKKTMDFADVGGSKEKTQLAHKIRLSRELPNIQGNCWWPGYLVTSNYKGIADELAGKHYATRALVPVCAWLDDVCPDPVRNLTAARGGGHVTLRWNAPATDDPMQMARFFAIYRDGVLIDVTDACSYVDLDAPPQGRHTYAVTVLDRVGNESSAESATL